MSKWLESLVLATTDSTEALDRVIRAHVEKALEMARNRAMSRWSVNRESGDRVYESDYVNAKAESEISYRRADEAETIAKEIERIATDDVMRGMGGRW